MEALYGMVDRLAAPLSAVSRPMCRTCIPSYTVVLQDKKVYLKMLTILTLVGTVVGAVVAAVGMLMQVGVGGMCVLAGCVLRVGALVAAVGMLMQVGVGGACVLAGCVLRVGALVAAVGMLMQVGGRAGGADGEQSTSNARWW